MKYGRHARQTWNPLFTVNYSLFTAQRHSLHVGFPPLNVATKLDLFTIDDSRFTIFPFALKISGTWDKVGRGLLNRSPLSRDHLTAFAHVVRMTSASKSDVFSSLIFHVPAVTAVSTNRERNQALASGLPVRFFALTVPLSSSNIADTDGNAMIVIPKFAAVSTGTSTKMLPFGPTLTDLAKAADRTFGQRRRW